MGLKLMDYRQVVNVFNFHEYYFQNYFVHSKNIGADEFYEFLYTLKKQLIEEADGAEKAGYLDAYPKHIIKAITGAIMNGNILDAELKKQASEKLDNEINEAFLKIESLIKKAGLNDKKKKEAVTLAVDKIKSTLRGKLSKEYHQREVKKLISLLTGKNNK